MTKTLKTTAAVVIMTSLKDIKSATDMIKTSGKELQELVHRTACSVLAHTHKHRNINVLTDFLDAVPDMVRKNALQQWFETFGSVEFTAAKEGDKPSWRMRPTGHKVRLGDAMVKPFWKFKANEGAPYQAMDMKAYLQSNISKLEKDIKNVPFVATPDMPVDVRVGMLKAFKDAKGGYATLN